MIIFHIDVNNAFLSWDAVHRLTKEGGTLDLRTLPAVIGGSEKNRHGIVLAKSMPARSYGIRTAETLAEARRKCPGLIIVPPRHPLYKEYSAQLMDYLRTLSPAVEQYSIDEAFLDMSGCPLLSHYMPAEAADFIRREILRRFGYTVNIGVSTNKLLAKMASGFEKPDKTHCLFPEEIADKMWPLPVDRLFFVGHASASKLYNLGIRTIGDLARFDKEILRSHMGKHGAMIHDYANGIDPSPVLHRRAEAKAYGNSTTLPSDVTDPAQAKKTLFSLCGSVSARLQNDSVLAQVIAVSIKNNQFQTVSHQRTLTNAANTVRDLYDCVCELFDECWDGSPIRLLGVSASKLTKENLRQLNLMDSRHYLKQGKLENAVDQIRKKFGEGAIFRASTLEKKSAFNDNIHKDISLH